MGPLSLILECPLPLKLYALLRNKINKKNAFWKYYTGRIQAAWTIDYKYHFNVWGAI